MLKDFHDLIRSKLDPEVIERVDREADKELDELFFMSERQASKSLGVCSSTLKAWALKGKIGYSIHPLTKKRRYNKTMVLKLKEEIEDMK
jgi:predicted acetyltransferase